MKERVTEPENRRAMIVPLTMVILFILAVLGIAVYNYMRFERNLVARLQYASVAEKFAQAAAFEASNWYNCKVLSLRDLDKNKPIDRFVLAPVLDRAVNGQTVSLTADELRSFELVAGLKGTIDRVELKYEGFANYFKTPSEPSNFTNSCVLADDPFERFGGLVITSKATYKTVSKTFCCRYEIKIANTLVPLLSKFTFFTKDKDKANENQLEMGRGGKYKRFSYGGQGLISEEMSPKRVPLIFIHHPEDVMALSTTAYLKNHTEIREFLPVDDSVAPTGTAGSGITYRPQMTNRGWVFLGNQNTPDYLLNVTPGKVNPDVITPYPQNENYLFYGCGFFLLESDFYSLVMNSLKGNFPYSFSFIDAKKPDDVHDYILRITHCGVYWLYKHPEAKPIIGNFYAARPELVDTSSLLSLEGDMQAHAFTAPSKPSRYLDRRSPTIVFGRVIRSYGSIGTIMQNVNHPPGSPYANSMLESGMHKIPFEVCKGVHSGFRYVAYFNINDNDKFSANNPTNHPDSADWGWQRILDDAFDGYGKPFIPPVDFALVKHDFNDIFNITPSHDANHIKTYKFFMTKVVFEPFNKTYNWITSNSRPNGGIIEPGEKYGLRQDKTKILSSYPAAQPDDLFFYIKDKTYGNCMNANNIKISQYKNNSGSFAADNTLFPDGVFRGALAAATLSSADYKNPMLENKAVPMVDFDIRHKASHIFNKFSDFAAVMLKITGDTAELKDSGVFYVDQDSECDLTLGKKIQKLVFHDNVMIIFRKGVTIPSINKSSYARQNKGTLTIVSVDGDVTIGGAEVEASLNSLNGTIKKAVDYFQVFGNLTMKILNFDLKSSGSLFKVSSFPPGTVPILGTTDGEKSFIRSTVMYDPALDPCDIDNYTYHYKYYVSSRQTYWRFFTE